MSAPKKLDNQTETQVVAMIARGDKHQAIVDWLRDDKGVDLSIKTIALIKERNKPALEFMSKEMAKNELTHATAILSKSRQLIDKRLDKAMQLEKDMRDLRKQYDDGEIDGESYYNRLDILLRSQLSVTELNSLSKESFNQSQIEAGKPTSISDSPQQARANLDNMLRAIASGDQESMVKALFPDA